MEWRFMLHFIWVFTVCKNTHLGVISIQMVKSMEMTHVPSKNKNGLSKK